MKRFKSVVLLLCFTTSIVAVQGQNPEMPTKKENTGKKELTGTDKSEKTTYLTVNGHKDALTQRVDPSGNRISYTLSTNAETWYVQNPVSWIDTYKSGDKLILEIDANNGTSSRSARLVIMASDRGSPYSEKTVTINIEQAGVEPQMFINGNNASSISGLEYNCFGGDYSLSVSSNVPEWSITDYPSWFSSVKKEHSSISFNISKNYGSNRKGKLLFRCGNKTFTLNVSQDGGCQSTQVSEDVPLKVNGLSSVTKSASYQGDSYYMSVSGGASSFNCTGVSDSWISVTNQSGNYFTLKVLPNYSSYSRSTYFYVNSGAQMVKVSVYQDGRPSSTTESINPRRQGVIRWPWNNDAERWLGGLTLGYSNNQMMEKKTDGSTWVGDYVMGKENSYLHGSQLGFHVQYYTDWTLGIGLYSGTFFSYYSKINEANNDPYRRFREYSATVPLHLFLRIPLFVNNVSIIAHGGVDATYYWGGLLMTSNPDYQNVAPDYGVDNYHDALNIGASAGAGIQIGQFQAEAMYSVGLKDHNSTAGVVASLNQFAFRLSYLFYSLD